METRTLQDLFRHMEWADALVWKSIFALPAARTDENLRARLYHTHAVQWAYLQLCQRQPLDLPEESSFKNLPSIYDWVRDFHPQAADYIDGLDATELGETIEIPWAEQVIERLGKAEPASLGLTLLQVVYHTTYHRGQINTRLRELGGEPPLTDFIAWIWTGKPPPMWDEPS